MPKSSLNVYVKVCMQDLKKSGVIVRLLELLNIFFLKVGWINPAMLSRSCGNMNACVTFWKPKCCW